MKGQFFPLIRRDLRLEVPERMDSRGEVVTALDAAAVADAAQSLLTAGCEAVVVHFLHSYANPEHEIQAAGLIQSIWRRKACWLCRTSRACSSFWLASIFSKVAYSFQPSST